MRRPVFSVLLAAAVLPGAVSARILYSTTFPETLFPPNPGFWAGVDGWLSNFPDNGSVAVTTDGGAVYIGSVNPGTDAGVFAWRSLNFQPLAKDLPVVKISTTVGIVDSTNAVYDPFGLALYNRSGQLLCALFLENNTQHWYFDDGSGPRDIGKTFPTGVFLKLDMRLDFSTRFATATMTISGTATKLLENEPFDTPGRKLDIGEIDYLWLSGSGGQRGDNYLVVDSLLVSADALPRLRVKGGRKQSTKSSAITLSGKLDEEAGLIVEWRAGHSKRWKKARMKPSKWTCKVRGLLPGKNKVEARTVNARKKQVDLEKITVTRR